MPGTPPDVEPLLRRYGLARPLVALSGPSGVSGAVCPSRADTAPWLIVVSHDEAGHSESTAAPIPGPIGTLLSGDVLVAGGIAAYAGALMAEVDGIEQRVEPTRERAWLAIFAPVTPPARMTIRTIDANAEALGGAETDPAAETEIIAETVIGPSLAEPQRRYIEVGRARLRRLRSGRFPSGTASY